MEGAGQEPFLICASRSFRVALPLSSVIETLRPLPVDPVGGMPHFVLGLSVIRGEPTPVVDSGLLLSSAPVEKPSRFVTLKAGGRSVALSMDAVIGVRNLAAQALSSLPPLLKGASQEAVQAIGVLDQALLVVLQAARVIPESLWPGLEAERAGS